MNSLRCTTFALLALSLAPLSLAQPAAPTPPAPQPIQLDPNSHPTAQAIKKTVYDESANARVQISTAVAAAKKNNRRVLIQWGGNWCPWCLRMNDLMHTDKALAHELLYEYDLIHIDCGRPAGKNMDIAKFYKADVETEGFPYLTILNADGQMIANNATSNFELKNAAGETSIETGHDPKKLLKFLTDNQAKPAAAQPMLDKALEAAKSSNKTVFLHFGAPWCGWCHKLEDWMAKPDIAALLTKDFIDLKIDIDRDTGGQDMLIKYAGKDYGGIPWFLILGADGKPIADSMNSGKNIGFPAEPSEIEHFGAMLKKSAKKLTPAEIDSILASLKK